MNQFGTAHHRHTEATTTGYQEVSHRVSITPEEREIGSRTKRYFDSTLKRRPPWLIKNNRVRLDRSLIEGELAPPVGSTMRESIDVEDVQREQISPLLASVLFTFKRIEDKLPDYMGRSYDVFRNVWGINASYHQWGYEENQHSDALGLVLAATNHVSRDEQESDYYDGLGHTWELPFATGRQMVIYAAFQEQLTHLAYLALMRRAVEEGAPLVGRIIRLIAQDEAYHGGGYRAFSRIYAELDLEGTIDDALYVARNFRMPAQHLMRNRRRDSVDIVRVGAFSRELVTEETLFKVLRGFRFVPDDLAKATAREYWTSDVSHIPVSNRAV
jgi:hypothetical protein